MPFHSPTPSPRHGRPVRAHHGRLTAILATLAVAASGLLAASAPANAAVPADDAWQGPLSTNGAEIIDATGKVIKWRGANWSGASGTYKGTGDRNDLSSYEGGVNPNYMPIGVDRKPIAAIVSDLKSLGINMVRLPFSNEMLHRTVPVPASAVAANPQLIGKTPLQVFDAVIAELTAQKVAVVLNNHTTTDRWCCGQDDNEFWDSQQSTQQWIDDWVMLATRYKSNPGVVGADLRNEVRTGDNPTSMHPVWGPDDSTAWQRDLWKAYELALKPIQQANPEILVILEGVNWSGIPVDGPNGTYLGGRPDLQQVSVRSNTGYNPHKLVYSAHFYAFTGPNQTGKDEGIGVTSGPRYRDMDKSTLYATMDQHAGYLAQPGGPGHGKNPIWISEFGVGRTDDADPEIAAKERAWWSNMVDYLVDRRFGFAAWPAVTWADANGKFADSFALIAYKADGTKLDITSDWRNTAWQRLVAGPALATWATPAQPRWNQLVSRGESGFGDFGNRSWQDRANDWAPGDDKLNCPDNEFLAGVSRTNNQGKYQYALCTTAGIGARAWKGAGRERITVNDESNITYNWAYSYDKRQCPQGWVGVGMSKEGYQPGVERSGIRSIRCERSPVTLPVSNGRTVWIDQGNNRPSTASGDWAWGQNKGECRTDEYVAGIAMTWARFQYGTASAILCKPLPAASATPNLALGSSATQSSTFQGVPASRAVDGNTGGSTWAAGGITHTNYDTNAWWQTDLGAAQGIGAIDVWNRTEAATERLSDYWVFVSPTPFTPGLTPAQQSAQPGVWSVHQTSQAGSPTHIPVGASGRYVMVQLNGTDYLSLAEVQVFGLSNLAIGSSATQSSSYGGGDNAPLAVDGNTNGDWFQGSVTHTNNDTNAWWRTDLGASKDIASVEIWNRTDDVPERLSNYWVFVSNTPFNTALTPAQQAAQPGVWSQHLTAQAGVPTHVPVGTPGRYVMIQLDGANWLSLAEVQVIG